MTVQADAARFYALLDRLETRIGGAPVLAECNGNMNWPRRGVYFFFEAGENRLWPGVGRRVVCVGTHALKTGSKATLWKRLSQHRGSIRSNGGNHRGSIFRLLVGNALARRGDTLLPPSWGVASDFGAAAKRLRVDTSSIKRDEAGLEALVSSYIGAMPFLWLTVDDTPGPGSQRALIERNTIALLSVAEGEPSPDWLGRYSDREPVRSSGLWNNRHVRETYDPSFLDLLEQRIAETQHL